MYLISNNLPRLIVLLNPHTNIKFKNLGRKRLALSAKTYTIALHRFLSTINHLIIRKELTELGPQSTLRLDF